MSLVTQKHRLFGVVVARVKQAVAATVKAVPDDLLARFPEVGQQYAVFSMLQLRFWRERAARLPAGCQAHDLMATVQEELTDLVNAAARQYGGRERVLPDGTVAAPLLDGELLKKQRDMFAALMIGMVQPGRPHMSTPALWEQLFCDPACMAAEHRRHALSEFVKLFKISAVFPIGSIKNERRFSLMNLIHTELRNRLLPDHLNTCVNIAASMHTWQTFPGTSGTSRGTT